MAAPSPLSVSFADLLRHHRMAADLTQEELAARANLSVDAISTLERGARRKPRKDTVALLADALALPAEDRAAFAAAARRSPVNTLALPRADRSAVEASARHGRVPLPLLPTTPSTHAASSHSWPLVGRAPERAVLELHLAGEGPPLLLLAGEPGIGKSRLLHEASGFARAAGWTVLCGGCAWRGGEHPYAPMLEAVRSRFTGHSPTHLPADLAGCAWLVHLLPELAEFTVTPISTWTPPAEQERGLMFAAVGRFLANIAGPVGTLLVLDDLQWAGADALDLLASLVQGASAVAHAAEPASAPTPAVRVIGAYRDTEVRADDPLATLIADLGRDRLVATQRVAPLNRSEALDLADELLAGMMGHEHSLDATQRTALAERLHEWAGGVPYFLVSCAHALQASGLKTSMLTPPGRYEGAPWDVAQSIHQRIAVLPQLARELLGVAAIAGRGIPFSLLVAVLPGPERDLLAALGATCHARLLEEMPGSSASGLYQFAHDLIRDVVFAELTKAHRVALHRTIGEALAGHSTSNDKDQQDHIDQQQCAAEVAYHFLEAGERVRTLPYTLLAGDAAEAVYAHKESERHYRMAVKLAAEANDQAREAAALEKLSFPVLLLGREEEARGLREQALELYESLGDREGELRLCGHLLELWGPSALVRAQLLADRVVAEGASAASRGLAALYNGLAQVYQASGRTQEQLATSMRAEQIARLLGDDAMLVEALHWHAMAAGDLGEDVLQAWFDLLPLAERIGDLFVLGNAFHSIAQIYLYGHGDFVRAKAYLEQALDVAERRGSAWGVIFTLAGWAEYHYFAGEWEPGRMYAERATALMSQVERTGTYWALSALGMFDLAQGRDEDAEQYLGQAVALAMADGDLHFERMGHRLLAEHDLVAGHAAAAYARLEPLLDRPDMQELDAGPLLPLMALAALDLDRDEQAAATLAACKVRCGPLWLVDALRVEAVLHMKQAHWQEAEAALEETLALCRALPCPYAEAKALAVHGQLHAAKGEPERARERYMAARAICEQLGERLYRPQIERALAGLTSERGSNTAAQ
jgi:transcriptional regulator with XRE-family HTH domain/tetratricopeptide (TPR) repeat protein